MSTTTQSHSYLRSILMVCTFNLLLIYTTFAQADEVIVNTTLTLRPLSELTELALLNSPELKNNQVDYARQTLTVKLQKRSWLDNISVNTNSVYGNGSIADANNNGTTTAYVLSDRKSLNYNVGFGKQQLSNECGDGVPCPPEKHQENRRTEIRVLKSGGSEGKIMPQSHRK